MSTETLPFENITVKVEKYEDEDINEKCPEVQENCKEHRDPLHDFPIDTEEVKVEVSEDSALPGDIANLPSSIPFLKSIQFLVIPVMELLRCTLTNVKVVGPSFNAALSNTDYRLLTINDYK
ncbi:uncharacterized protein LOC141529937 isoform X2 [Cotesia typhae]|uniref:uncharacterized protein LOC141529937 isoform X2 n=1 Tax=Cotesia typhae TaxID=2053667 RepID=UPI003D684C01